METKATKLESLTTKKKAATFVLAEISNFGKTSSLNNLPGSGHVKIYDKPLVQFADGDDPIFTQFKKIIDPTHLTPREALAKALQKNPKEQNREKPLKDKTAQRQVFFLRSSLLVPRDNLATRANRLVLSLALSH